MAYRYEKDTGDLVIDGFEKGIAPSPHKGIGNLQCANISTESGEVLSNYGRLQQSQVPISSGTFNAGTSTHVIFLQTGTILLPGTWVHVTASTISGLATGYYWVYYDSSDSLQIVLSTAYATSVSPSYGLTGTATFSTVDMGVPIQNQSCVEQYNDGSNVTQYRYYVGDQTGRVWCYDTGFNNTFFAPGHTIKWSMTGSQADAGTSYATVTGLAVLQGNLLMFTGNSIYYRPTSRLDKTWASATQTLNSLAGTKNSHFAIVNHNNYCFYCDSNFVGQIIPSSVSSAGNANIWSYGTFTSDGASPSVLTVTNLYGGDLPVNGATINFRPPIGGSLTNLTEGTIYYVVNANKANGTFQVSTTVGGSGVNTISASTGSTFNTFWPNPATSGSATTISFQALQLSSNDISQCLVELGSTLLVGCQSNSIYSWNEIAVAGGGSVNIVQLPENNTSSMVQANNVAYAFVGNKGNCYVTNGSSVSTALTVPDYCAGIASNTTPLYIEPYFSWGGTAYMRGRIWFSVQDQTSGKTGNCGGIWSFVPSFYNSVTGQDTGSALRMENENSYGTYNGMANIILPLANQAGLGPQYYSVWTSDQNSAIATYGIDATNTTPTQTSGGTTVIETDIIPTGTILGKEKKTFGALEFKLSAPLVSGESVTIKFRQNLTDAFAIAGTSFEMDSSNLSGVYQQISYEKGQWLQFRVEMTSTTSNPSFCRLAEIRQHTI